MTHQTLCDSLLSQYTLPDTGTWFWRVTAFNLCGDSILSEIRKIVKVNPALNPKLQLWLSADEGITVTDSVVSQWADLSGNLRNAYQNTAGLKPTRVESGLNNQPAIRFDGSNDFLSMDSSLTIGSVYAIFRWNGNEVVFPTYNGLITEKTGSASSILFGAQPSTSKFYPGLFGSNLFINRLPTIDFAPINQYKLV